MPQQYGVKMKKKEETKRTCVKLKTASNFHPRDPLCSVLLCNRTAAAYAKSYADILLFDSFLFLLTSILVSKCSKWVWLVHRRYLPKSHLSPSGFLHLRFGSCISSTIFSNEVERFRFLRRFGSFLRRIWYLGFIIIEFYTFHSLMIFILICPSWLL